MHYTIIVIFSSIVYVSGFLLDDKTAHHSTVVPVMTDRHYDMLMDLLIEERRARRQQDQTIKQLQQDFMTMQQEVTLKYHVWMKTNGTDEKRFLELESKVRTFQLNLDVVQNKNLALHIENSDFNQTITNLEKQVELTQQENVSYKTKLVQLENEITSLKNLKTISDLQSVYNVWNETKHLEREIQNSNHDIDELKSDANARKQDFQALYTKVDETDRKLEQRWSELTNRVVLTATPVQNTYTSGTKLDFNDIRVSRGLTNIDYFKNHGTFICEKSGLYQISFFITTYHDPGSFQIFKNNIYYAGAFVPKIEYASYQTTTAIYIDHLNINDTLCIKTNGNLIVYDGMESAFSIVQIL